MLRTVGHYNSMVNYYRDIHRLKACSNYNLFEINSMIPYEFEIYSMQVLKDIQEQQKRNR